MANKLDIHHSSLSSEWATDQNDFNQWHREFRFKLDACATAANTKLPKFISPLEDALKVDWKKRSRGGAIFCNPPYGDSVNIHRLQRERPAVFQQFIIPAGQKGAGLFDVKAFRRMLPDAYAIYGMNIRQWVEKAATAGVLVALLIPSRTDTGYFHTHVWDKLKHRPRRNVQLRFIDGRLHFGGHPDAAPFPSALVIFNYHLRALPARS